MVAYVVAWGSLPACAAETLTGGTTYCCVAEFAAGAGEPPHPLSETATRAAAAAAGIAPAAAFGLIRRTRPSPRRVPRPLSACGTSARHWKGAGHRHWCRSGRRRRRRRRRRRSGRRRRHRGRRGRRRLLAGASGRQARSAATWSAARCPPGAVVVGCDPPLGDVDASAEFETNITVKLVAASAMLASPAIFARLVSFNAVTRLLLAAGKSGARTVGAQAGRSACHRAAMPWCPTSGTPERNAIER